MRPKDGLVEQRNFDAYTPPYMPDAPAAVDVHIVPSAEPPAPVISPAVANALAELTGRRYRTLPPQAFRDVRRVSSD